MTTSVLSVRSRMAAASARTARLRKVDRAAVVVITLGGIAVVVAVLGILVFVASQAVPLFRSATIEPLGRAAIPTGLTTADAAALHAVGVDEYRRHLYTVERAGVLAIHELDTGRRKLAAAVPDLGGATVTASARAAPRHQVAAGLSDGRVSLMQVRFIPRYEGEVLTDLAPDVRVQRTFVLDPAARPILQLSYAEYDGTAYVAGLVSPTGIVCWWASEESDGERAVVSVPEPHRIRRVRLGRGGALLAATDRGAVFEWELSGPEPAVVSVSQVSRSPITALEWMLGGNSWVAAAEDGTISGWLRIPTEAGGHTMARSHTFEAQGAPVVWIALSGRERSFATLGRDGTVVLRHQTSERVLARLQPAGLPAALLITPKADGLIALDGNTAWRYALENPHPEISWKTLFGKVWYEGYARPEYVWQSTGATDDVEPKFSLVPLVFGTIKGTFYAMLFAVPLAVLAALYTSQFAHPRLRGAIKPTVEIMAALPSVVIGFLAGLYLAGVVERNLVAVLIMVVVMPLAGTAGVVLWRILPGAITNRLGVGWEIGLIVPLLLVAGWLSVAAGPTVEFWLFNGDARLWLKDAWGLTYDQRNCLVVGIAMGFAVIPIIFTISEDAFSSVPSSLPAASLALGGTRWQTAVRVVLPTASPGIFSAIMVGFGRAVGETMIVLMATGNTPVMDWSIFNGIRTLSANIAVEIPEAPYGGTLYRTLFLAAAMLFVMTFLVNTIAEIIRQRLRDRYRAI